LHYEQRIAEAPEIATRERNWHDLLECADLVALPQLKAALTAAGRADRDCRPEIAHARAMRVDAVR
jgi:hypothetical protein